MASAVVRKWWKADIARWPYARQFTAMEIYKDSLPAGLSYALKPSALEAVLRSAGVTTSAALYQWRSGWAESSVIFGAHFYPAGRHYRNQEELLTITSRAVPSLLRSQARTYIESSVLPEFVMWIVGLEHLPAGSPLRRETQAYARTWQSEQGESV